MLTEPSHPEAPSPLTTGATSRGFSEGCSSTRAPTQARVSWDQSDFRIDRRNGERSDLSGNARAGNLVEGDTFRPADSGGTECFLPIWGPALRQDTRQFSQKRIVGTRPADEWAIPVLVRHELVRQGAHQDKRHPGKRQHIED